MVKNRFDKSYRILFIAIFIIRIFVITLVLKETVFAEPLGSRAKYDSFFFHVIFSLGYCYEIVLLTNPKKKGLPFYLAIVFHVIFAFCTPLDKHVKYTFPYEATYLALGFGVFITLMHIFIGRNVDFKKLVQQDIENRRRR